MTARLCFASESFIRAKVGFEWTADDGQELVSVDLFRDEFSTGTYLTFTDPAVALQLADVFQEAAARLRARQLVAQRNAAVAVIADDPFVDGPNFDEPDVDRQPFDMSGPSRHAGQER